MRIYRGLKPIKAMTFDLDDTLYDNWPADHEGQRKRWRSGFRIKSTQCRRLSRWKSGKVSKQQVASENPVKT